MKPGSVEIVVVLDRSGSMASIKKDMEGGFNHLIADQKKIPGDCKVTLVQFNTEVETRYRGLALADVPNLRMTPSGGTALYDAVASAIDETGARLASLSESERPSRVLFIIITDGEENSSVFYRGAEGGEQVKAKIAHQVAKYAWDFVYLGSDLNTEKAAAAVGLHTMNTVMYSSSAVGTRNLYQAANAAIRATRVGGPGGQSIAFNADTIRSHMPEDKDESNDGG